jgi:signal transduction histidine kinase
MSLSNRKTLNQINEIANELERILDQNTDEKVMSFTEDKEIAHMLEEINRVLEDRQNVKVDYRKSELGAKRMLSNISHDIKTPLTVILGYLEIMLLHEEYDGKMLKKVSDKAQQLMSLVDQFFTLAKLEAGDTVFTMSKIDLNEFCRESIIDFYEILTEKVFEVEIQIPKEAVAVYADRDALGRILSNLISNAIRYGCDGHYLGLTLRMDESFAYVDITDHGKGIASSEISYVFDRLYTLDDSRNCQVHGNGLGLTIAKNLTERMNGTLILNSIQNQKTEFTLKLKRFKY